MEREHTRSDRIPMIQGGSSTKHYQPCIDLIRRNLCVSWVSSLLRIGVIVIIFVLRDTLIVDNVWAFLFYMLLALIDIISLIGEVNTYQFLRKECKTLQNIDEQRRQGVTVTERVRVGDYTTYLSPYEVIYRYKFGYKPTSSSYTIIRYLHAITCFAIFGALGLRECRRVAVLLETLALAVLLLSVYIINFELDYLQLETAKGKYQEIESLSQGVKQQIVRKFIQWRKTVAVMYAGLVMLLLVGLILLVSVELTQDNVGLVISICICALMVSANIYYQLYFTSKKELLEQRISFPNFADRISSPHHLLYELSQSHPRLFVLLNTGMRVSFFSLYITTMYYSSGLHDSTVSLLIACACLCAAAQIIKLMIGHRMRIDYFLPVQLTTQKRVSMTCSICLSNYVDNVTQVQLPCSPEHTFHKSCLDNWLQSKKECPLCRYDLGQFMK